MYNILITGSNGQLGQSIKQIVENETKLGNKYFFVSRSDIDINDYDKLNEFVSENKINYIVNCAAYTNVDGAEDDYKGAYKCNCQGVKVLSDVCRKHNVRLIHISTDYVFNGLTPIPYKNTDKINPKTNYGGSKSLGESAIRTSDCEYMILRTSWLYSQYGKNFCKTMLKLFNEKDELNVVFDQVGSPTYAVDLARFIIYVITNDKFSVGTYHFSNKGVASWYDFTKAIYEISEKEVLSDTDEYKCKKINCCLSTEFVQKAKRPNYSVLDCTETEKTFEYNIPYWRESLKECIEKIFS